LAQKTAFSEGRTIFWCQYVALTNAPIEMADTSYGRFLAMQKRDAKRVFQHMSPAEREAFLRRLTKIDAADAKDGQSPPTNPTPVQLTSN
jgi:hypothetical protein